MVSSRLLVVALLGLTTLASIHFIIVSGHLNGYFALNEAWEARFPDLLPLSAPEEPCLYRRSYTGIAPIDMVVGRMTPIFWPLVTGVKPELTLFGIYMFGQVWASETLLIVEGWRVGNMGRAVSYSTIWGLTWQNLPWGLIQPLYNVVNLLTSPIAKSRTPPSPATISADPAALRTLFCALVVGYALPTLLMSLPSGPGRYISYDANQILLFIWQLFPLWVGLSHEFLTALHRQRSPASTSPLKKIAETRRQTLKGLRSVYTAAMAVAGITHLVPIALVLFNNQLAPYLPAILVANDPGAVFRPWPAVPNFAHYGKVPQVKDVAEGFLVLLQYDTIFAGLGVLVWAMWLRSRIGGTGYGLRVLASAIWQTALFGPCGAAVGQIWARDEVVFRGAGQEKKKM